MKNMTIAEMLLILHRIGAVQIDAEHGFKLAIHDTDPTLPRSPIYFNLRTQRGEKTGPLLGPHVQAIAQLMFECVHDANVHYSAVCGIPNAGTPFAHAFARSYAEHYGERLQVVELKKVYNEDGTRSAPRIAEELEHAEGMRVLLIDDLISDGFSKHLVVRELVRADMVVEDILVFLDRQNKAGTSRKMLRKMNCTLHAVVTITDVLEFYQREGIISSSEAAVVLRYFSMSTKPEMPRQALS